MTRLPRSAASGAYERLRDRLLAVYPPDHHAIAVRLDYENGALVRRTEDTTRAFPLSRLHEIGPMLTTAHTLVIAPVV